MTPRRLALIATVFALGCAVLIGVLASRANTEPAPPETVPRGLGLLLLFVTPAAIGLIGALSGRRVLLVIAAVSYILVSPLSFAGVTLVFLLPALLLLRAAIEPKAERPSAPIRPVRLLVFGVTAVPMAIGLVLVGGIFSLLVIVLVAGVAPALVQGRKPTGGRLRVSEAILGLAVLGLVIGSFGAFLGLTETVCWRTFETPSGELTEPVPPTEPGAVDPIAGRGSVGGGCSTGNATATGAGVAAVMAVGAIALSGLAARTPTRPTASGPAVP